MAMVPRCGGLHAEAKWKWQSQADGGRAFYDGIRYSKDTKYVSTSRRQHFRRQHRLSREKVATWISTRLHLFHFNRPMQWMGNNETSRFG
jgi:hypothetical protein